MKIAFMQLAARVGRIFGQSTSEWAGRITSADVTKDLPGWMRVAFHDDDVAGMLTLYVHADHFQLVMDLAPLMPESVHFSDSLIVTIDRGEDMTEAYKDVFLEKCER